MAIPFSQTSLSRLSKVHPDMVRVVKRAAQMATKAEDFMVLEGVRTEEQCFINYGKGRSAAECKAAGVPVKYAKPIADKVTWLKNPLGSKHVLQADGYSHAVDLVPVPIDWNNLRRFDKMAKLILRAAELEGVKIRWGADWNRNGVPRERGETDSPHFELDL